MKRPETTLFMLSSLDGKISTGYNDSMDVDSDYTKIPGVAEGLQQYYDLEQETDLHSLNSARVLAKIGVNESKGEIQKTPVNFIVIDNEPHLTDVGVRNLIKKSNKLYIVSTNKNHTAKDFEEAEFILYENEIDFTDLFENLKSEFEVDKMIIQTGGTLNSIFLRAGLIDHVSLVIAPALIGSKDTATLIDGESLHSIDELQKIKALYLREAKELKHSYLHLIYDIVKK